MRQLKFRAWDKERKEMLPIKLMDFSQWWVSCDPSYKNLKPFDYGERNSFKNDETDRHIIMQYTGLKDKNGTEIYEGDRLSHPNGQNFVVEWNNLGWAIRGHRLFIGWSPDVMEITGNIYENPELLEV